MIHNKTNIKHTFGSYIVAIVMCMVMALSVISIIPQKAEAAINSSADYAFDYIYYSDTYADLKAAYGYNEAALRNHWLTYGIREGRAGSPIYDGRYYLSHNQDLIKAYGANNYVAAYNHFITWGFKEKRVSSQYYYGEYYRRVNADLRNMSSESLLSHYAVYGCYERRNAGSRIFYGDTANSVHSGRSGKLQIAGSQKISNGKYRIISGLNGFSCIDIQNGDRYNGANAHLWAKAGSAQNQVFNIEYLGNGSYRIIATHSNKVLDINNGVMCNSSNVKQWDWANVLNQQWIIVDRGNGYYSIHSAKDTRYVIDVSGGRSNNGTNIQIYQYNGSAAQLFRFESASNNNQNTNANTGSNWDSLVGKTVANIGSKYYTSDNISYKGGYKGQCTWYSYGRFYEVNGIKLRTARNAKYWLNDNSRDSRLRVSYGSGAIKPKSIAVRTSGRYGHVMFVENVTYNSNGTPAYVYYTECNADGNGVYNAGSDCIVKKLSYSNFINQKKPAGYISVR